MLLALIFRAISVVELDDIWYIACTLFNDCPDRFLLVRYAMLYRKSISDIRYICLKQNQSSVCLVSSNQ